MIAKVSLAAGLLVLGVAMAPQTSTAASFSPAGITTDRGHVQEAHWRSRCARWRRECRSRWGHGSRYRRCLRRHRC